MAPSTGPTNQSVPASNLDRHVGNSVQLSSEKKVNRAKLVRRHHQGWVTATAGAASGVLCALCVAPLDVVKARLQVQVLSKGESARYKGTVRSLSRIFREEGMRGMYRGLPPTLLGYVPSWSIYFTCYGTIQNQLNAHVVGIDHTTTTVIAAVGAGAISNTFTNPFWVVRTRLQTQEHVLKDPEYRSTMHAFLKIYRAEGWRAFYKGLAASFLGLSHVAVQFPLYEWLKRELNANIELKQQNSTIPKRQDSGQQHSKVTTVIFASSISKIVATLLTYPHEVIRTRMHVHREHSKQTLLDTTKTMLQEEGLSAFYRGLGTNLLRVTPACAVTFTSYELFVRILSR